MSENKLKESVKSKLGKYYDKYTGALFIPESDLDIDTLVAVKYLLSKCGYVLVGYSNTDGMIEECTYDRFNSLYKENNLEGLYILQSISNIGKSAISSINHTGEFIEKTLGYKPKRFIIGKEQYFSDEELQRRMDYLLYSICFSSEYMVVLGLSNAGNYILKEVELKKSCL